MPWRGPLLGRWGRPVVVVLCCYEVVALHPASRLPTISACVARFPPAGVALLVLLAHHWFLEQQET